MPSAVLLLAATKASKTTTSSGSGDISLLIILLLIVAFYFLFVRPRSRQARQQRQILETLSPGDEVLTGAGIYGTVLDVYPDRVTIETAPGTRLTVARSTIARRIDPADQPLAGGWSPSSSVPEDEASDDARDDEDQDADAWEEDDAEDEWDEEGDEEEWEDEAEGPSEVPASADAEVEEPAEAHDDTGAEAGAESTGGPAASNGKTATGARQRGRRR
ncbi:preprotein translocase subunit YajC [Aciditerrimonas ferrireducens]|jgi:preprotein translocase subunit YajC|uniref:Preprotein translocase subunit YajC n=1 Tax=Aciditerrimonas ferrireducens TaxID=667306 RepID=A0ABV6C2P5_9ACTN